MRQGDSLALLVFTNFAIARFLTARQFPLRRGTHQQNWLKFALEFEVTQLLIGQSFWLTLSGFAILYGLLPLQYCANHRRFHRSFVRQKPFNGVPSIE